MQGRENCKTCLVIEIFEKGENAGLKIGSNPPPQKGERNEPAFEYKNISGAPNSLA